MSAPAVPQHDLHQRVVSAVSSASKPVSFAGLVKLIKVKKSDIEAFRATLESAVNANEFYRWPGRSPCLWSVSPDETARQVILAAAATTALPKPELTKQAVRSKKLPGFSSKRLDPIVTALVAEKKLQHVPPLKGRSKLLVRTGDSEAYFRAARAFLEDKFRAAGFDPTSIFGEISARTEKLTVEPIDAPALILDAVRSLEPVKGVPVSTLRLRAHLPQLSKPVFDAAALDLRKREQVFLSRDADPHNVTQEEKDLLIDGQDGTYYVAISLR